ncbi:MAG TPA: four helix bundle protein [Petrimonas sp.]|uniref:four helix bundle protein n=1 Tax=Petrimonas sp. TaxID=2023866 RepID=UPI00175898EE|nr:four helix bundle protein [Petrimonas sp.]
MHNFRKLNIWLKSVELVTDIYRLTNTFPDCERFGLKFQMQDAAVSCPTNIAEGSAKSSNKDFARFLEISLGSLYELETELLVSSNLGYTDSEKYETLQNRIVELEKMIVVFKNQLDK